jgi:hypothetical protein
LAKVSASKLGFTKLSPTWSVATMLVTELTLLETITE